MALTSEEVDQARFEAGYPVVRIGAEPYITFSAVFSKAIEPYLTDTITSSATAVVASTIGAIASITLASPTGFVQGSSVVVDVGTAAENSMITTLTGSVATLSLFNAHGTSGAYPVKLRGAEAVVRDILARLRNIHDLLRTEAPYSAGVSQADQDVKFFGGKTYSHGNMGGTRTEVLFQQRMDARDELCSALGLPNLRRTRKAGNGNLSLY